MTKRAHGPTSLEAWEAKNIGLRPKTPTWHQCDAVIYTELSQMLAGGKTPEEAMRVHSTLCRAFT